MKIGAAVSGIGIVIPAVVWAARTALADGFDCVKARMADITAEVRFSRSYRAVGVVAEGWRVAAWGFIFILAPGAVPVPVLWAVPVATLAVSVPVVSVLGGGAVLPLAGVVVVVSGEAIPVRAVQISPTGGSGSVHGTVNNGLSHRLCVLGSS